MLMRLPLALITLLGLLAPLNAAAQSGFYGGTADKKLPDRMAFLVGVPYYSGADWQSLENVTRDLPEMQSVLAEIGFPKSNQYVVDNSSALDGRVGRTLIFQKLYAFVEDAKKKPKSVLIFYFAGHGFTQNGSMYLVPADAPIKYAEDPDRFGIRLADIVDILAAANPLAAIIIVDACRNLPFVQLPFLKGQDGAKLESGGFLTLARQQNPEDDTPNIGIFYSATKTEAALDGVAGKTSPFVTGLTTSIRDLIAKATGPGGTGIVSVRDVVDEAVERVRDLTDAKQNPRPDIPFGAKIPIFATQSAFKREEAAWNSLMQQLNAEVKSLKDWSPETQSELFYCKFRQFRQAYGYSYYWQSTAKYLAQHFSKEAVEKCIGRAGVGSTTLFAPTVSTVVAPSGTVDDKQIRNAQASEPVNLQDSQASGKSIDSEMAEVRLILDALSSKQRKVQIVEPTIFYQPKYPVKPRNVPLSSGETVMFMNYVDAEHSKANVYHESHGFGVVQTKALATLDGIVRLALSFDGASTQLSMEQKAVISNQLTAARAIRTVSASIRYPVGDGPVGFVRAQNIAGYIGVASSLPADKSINVVFPSMEQDSDLSSGLVTLSIIVETEPVIGGSPRSDNPQYPPILTEALRNSVGVKDIDNAIAAGKILPAVRVPIFSPRI